MAWDLRDVNLADLRSAVSVVPEEPFLFASSIHDNVVFACPEASQTAVAEALKDAAADGFTSAMELGTHTMLTERGANISGGQRQRLTIARAMLADPAVLVLDDATSAVDVKTEQLIHNALAQRRRQRTTILITHRMSIMASVERVIFIANGSVVASGTHSELLNTEPEYAEMLTQTPATSQTPATAANFV